MNRNPEPRLTIWSIPPFRQQLRPVASTVTMRDVRFLAAEIFGSLLYGLMIPVNLLAVAPSSFGMGPTAVYFSLALPYVLPTAIICAVVCGIAGAGAAWDIVGRAIRNREKGRLRCAIWGALGAGAPMLLGVAITGADDIAWHFGVQLLMMLFGAGIGIAIHWVIHRDEPDHSRGF